MMNLDFKTVYEKIIKANNILLVTHYNPDGDAVSSISIMIDVLTELNKKYLAYCHTKVTTQLSFLPHTEKISNKEINNFEDFDLIISLDCGSVSRTKLANEIKDRNNNQTYIEIDHHPKIEEYSDIELRDPEKSATTEVLYNFLKANNISINLNIANCILTGIITDTGNFLFPSTSKDTINIASEMLSKGVSLPKIVDHVWNNKNVDIMKLWGVAMSRLQINEKYNLAFSILTMEDVEKYNLTDDDLDGIANFITNLDDVKGVLFLKEVKGGKIKGSLRTNYPEIDISKLAHKLGGGGHAKASGFVINGRIKKTENGWKII